MSPSHPKQPSGTRPMQAFNIIELSNYSQAPGSSRNASLHRPAAMSSRRLAATSTTLSSQDRSEAAETGKPTFLHRHVCTLGAGLLEKVIRYVGPQLSKILSDPSRSGRKA